jgi:hypothetical protein
MRRQARRRLLHLHLLGLGVWEEAVARVAVTGVGRRCRCLMAVCVPGWNTGHPSPLSFFVWLMYDVSALAIQQHAMAPAAY